MLTSTSVVGNTQLGSKRSISHDSIIPLAAVLVPIVDFVVAFLLLIAMFVYYGIASDWHAALSWIFLLLALTETDAQEKQRRPARKNSERDPGLL